MPSSPENDAYYRLRHSAAHVMAEAVLQLFPAGKIAIGPPIEDGFYYDFDLPRPLTPDDLPAIEERMRAIVKGDYPFVYREISADDARKLFADQPYKLELIDGLAHGLDEYGETHHGDTVISTYKHGAFEDLCRGPHLERTREIPADGFKLLSVAGAYWRGDEQRPMLQRIYGTAWNSKAELDQYLWRQEEARKRDHRRLGKELGLFSFHEESPGSPFWLPNGTTLRQTIEDFVRAESRKRGYKEIRTPVVLDRTLWERSGHWSHYKENMYVTQVEGREFGLKPMNCLSSYLVYQEARHSFRDLPLRLAEITGILHRFELSGTLAGLLRVREFAQDDTHIFVTPDQLEAELDHVLEFAMFTMRAFGFTDLVPVLSVRDPANREKFLGSDEQWDNAEAALLRLARAHGLEPKIALGEAKFYAPSLDIMIRDALGREWQTTTIQIDFNAPERFDLEYIGPDNQPHRPLVIHRALLGSFERFIAVLIEHYAGAFPAWLAPVQATIIPISDEKHGTYGRQLHFRLEQAGLRVEIDDSKDRMQAKIRRAQLQKVPYMLIIGDKEQAADSVAVRLRSGEDLGALPVAAFIERANADIAARI
ncbi:MAG TPA: threonine--tRNA ligase [Roseiflexaceae bacterium]|nr:threonine--tRNA ligase [Roseiflexaceae bacterium]